MRHSWKVAALSCALFNFACGETPAGPAPDARGALDDVSAQAVAATDFTGTDVTVALIDPGTSIAAPPSVPQKVVIRGLTVLSRTDTTDPRATGNTTVVANGVLSLIDGSGPVHGSFRTEVDGGGVWQGQWHGRRAMTGAAQWTAELQVEGRGYGGDIDGMRISYTNTVTTFDVIPAASFGLIEGQIIDR